jgi:glycosyltransferase involved in cell wall biosynthesis
MNINSLVFDSVKRSRLSVIIPFYNEIDLIGRAVDSITAQYELDFDLQIIISNDGLIPNEMIQSKCHNNIFLNVVSNNSYKGPGGARNTAIANASGDLIAFLDADDIWLPGKLKAQFAAIDAGATFVATAYRFDTCQTVVQPPVSIDKPLDIFLRRGIGTSSVMITRALLADLRFKDIRFAQDIDYWYALAGSPHFRYAAVDVCLVEYSTSGSTKNKLVQLQYLHKVLRINAVPWLQHVRVLSSYVLAGVYNHYIKRLFT